MKFFILIFTMLSVGCSSTGYHYVTNDTLNTALVQECRTIMYGHSEDPSDTYVKQDCRKFFMTPDQLAGWKDLQKGIKARGLTNGIVVDD